MYGRIEEADIVVPGVEPGQLVVLQDDTITETVLTGEDDRLLRLPDGGVDLVVGKIAFVHLNYWLQAPGQERNRACCSSVQRKRVASVM